MNDITAIYDEAFALHNAGNLPAARVLYERIIHAEPLHANAKHLLGAIAVQEEDFPNAVLLLRETLAIDPTHASAYANLAIAYLELDQYQEAFDCCVRATALVPGHTNAHNTKGMVLRRLARYEEALAAHAIAAALSPNYLEGIINVGGTLIELNRHEEALFWLEHALAQQPSKVETNFILALCHLQMGNFDKGLEFYEWRWKKPKTAALMPVYNGPLWLGQESLCGKTIFLHHEQGFGDTIQFARYVPLIAALGANIIFGVPAALRPVLSHLESTTRMISGNEPIPPYHYHCPLMSLPLALGTRLDTIPATAKYISVSPAKIDEWSAKLGPKRLQRIGIAWSGNPDLVNDHVRSIPLVDFRMLDAESFDSYSLQKDVRETDRQALQARKIVHVGTDLNDFSDTAALIELMDLVITVDTSVAHLAAALGRPVFLLLSSNADWRWFRHRQDSPWYPTIKIFQQSRLGQWADVFDRVHAELKYFAGPQSGPAVVVPLNTKS